MRRQSLRPRQIDIHARMHAIRSEKDLIQDEESIYVHSYEELLTSKSEDQSQSKAKRKNIPTPLVLLVKSYEEDVKDDYVIPTSYIRVQNLPLIHEEVSRVELDLEIEDMKWIRKHPKYGVNGDPRYQLSLKQFGQMLDVLEKASAMINPNVITQMEAEEVFAKQLGIVRTPLSKVGLDVYNYWLQKRQMLKRPILRKYWPQTPLNDTNPHLVFRPREKERYKLRKHRKNDMEGYRKLIQLRNDFQKIWKLMDLVHRREKYIRTSINFLCEIRSQSIFEMITQSGQVRKPVVIVDEDRYKRRKGRKRLRREGGDDTDEGADSIDQNEHNFSASSSRSTKDMLRYHTGSGLAEDSLHIRSFLDYDTSNNFTMRDDHTRNFRQPYVVSYPLPTSLTLASILNHPQQYRLRGRLGRGSRFIIDRIPLESDEVYYRSEVMAATMTKSSESTVDFTSIHQESTTPIAVEASASSNQYPAVMINESSFRPPAVNRTMADLRSQLEEIYCMSDSEDEMIESVCNGLHDSSTSMKITDNSQRMVKLAIEL
uniref:Uncharacterized protein AlNc14C372G11113 n=1 Tax=Albugo laibachii Nc14 TaxID=890382 RepID=F0WY53_9STRA|nr:conserved hypothetical protein [Albugo laibachii Nc14]|eukprot:CCA26404.1 conserved hypothetical protein [Albugo laibachii Nc14]